MIKRAVYTFKDPDNTFHVYKHYDGYPSGAVVAISKSLELAWELPRFEADEFGAAFIAANKSNQGDVRLCHSYKCFYDLDYRYEITLKNKFLNIRAYERIWRNYGIDFDKKSKFKIIFSGSLDEFEESTKVE